MSTNFYCVRAARPPHCVEKFRPQYGDLYWPSNWSQLFSFNVDRLVIDVSWNVAHGVLYTADRLIGFGNAIDATCFCSTALEMPPHLFFSCPLAQSALSLLHSLMLSYSSSCPSLVCRHVLFGFAPCEFRSLPKVFIYDLNVCKFFIWHARNEFRFQGVRAGVPQLIAKVRSRVGFHLSLLFKRYKSLRRRRIFHRRWGAAGIIGSVVDDRFVLSSF